MPGARMLDQGAVLAFGTDAPVEQVNPLAGLAAAISRTDAAGEPFGGWRPEETISREQALAAYTANAAYAGFADGRFGRLTPGERADFVFLSADPLMAGPEQLRQIRVLETWVAGRLVYDADAANALVEGPTWRTAKRGVEAALFRCVAHWRGLLSRLLSFTQSPLFRRLLFAHAHQDQRTFEQQQQRHSQHDLRNDIGWSDERRHHKHRHDYIAPRPHQLRARDDPRTVEQQQ